MHFDVGKLGTHDKLRSLWTVNCDTLRSGQKVEPDSSFNCYKVATHLPDGRDDHPGFERNDEILPVFGETLIPVEPRQHLFGDRAPERITKPVRSLIRQI